MSLFKKKSSGFDEEQTGEAPAKSKGSLLVLLILVGAFAYLYFFTSLIVPHDTPKPKAPAGAVEVKQSLPPKPVTDSTAGPEVKKPEEAKPAPAAVPPVAPPPATAVKPPAPAVPPVPAKPSTPPAAAPAPSAPKAAVAPAPATAPPAMAKPAAPAAAKQTSPQKKEEAKAVTPSAGKEQSKSAAGKEPVKKGEAVAKATEKKKSAAYALLITTLPAGDGSKTVIDKLTKAGIKPVAKQESTKTRTMNRLYSGAYTDYDQYTSALEKLKVSAKGAFGIEKDGKYFLYAGSFSTKERAEKEKTDLSAKGVVLQVQQVVLPLASARLTAGNFQSKADADKAAARMNAEGVKATVVPRGR